MQFSKTEIPDEVLTAAAIGRLVVFAGAGVSMGPPANLPSFLELARKVARIDESIDEPFETFLGKLEARGVKVEKRVRALVSSSQKPTKTHESLMRIFPSAENVRVVTTNFDDLFRLSSQTVFGEKSQQIRKYCAPALPVGREFSGLVHLHGCIQHSDDRLVVTDRGFGLAYLTEGWATRFLFELFSHFTVLFVGYSHEDSVMKYLARGLPASNIGKRFALVRDSESKEKWAYMNVIPVPFPVINQQKPFEEFELALDSWSTHVVRRPLQKDEKVSQIAENFDDLSVDDEEFLLDALKQKYLCNAFAKKARVEDWIYLLRERDVFKSLLKQSDVELTEAEQVIAVWLAKSISESSALLNVISRNKGAIHHYLAKAILEYLPNFSGDEGRFADWLTIALNNFKRGESLFTVVKPIFPFLSQKYFRMSAVILLERLIKPVFSIENRSDPFDDFDDASTDISLKIHSPKYLRSLYTASSWLWERDASFVAEELLAIVVSSLESMYMTLTPNFVDVTDEVSLTGAPVLETLTERSFFQNLPSAYCVIAKCCIESITLNNVKLAASYASIWTQSKRPALRAFALYALSLNSDLNSNSKIEGLISLQAVRFLNRSDVLRLAELPFSEASPDAAEKWTHYLLVSFKQDESKSGRRAILEHLHFLLQKFSSFSELKSTWECLQTLESEMARRVTKSAQSDSLKEADEDSGTEIITDFKFVETLNSEEDWQKLSMPIKKFLFEVPNSLFVFFELLAEHHIEFNNAWKIGYDLIERFSIPEHKWLWFWNHAFDNPNVLATISASDFSVYWKMPLRIFHEREAQVEEFLLSIRQYCIAEVDVEGFSMAPFRHLLSDFDILLCKWICVPFENIIPQAARNYLRVSLDAQDTECFVAIGRNFTSLLEHDFDWVENNCIDLFDFHRDRSIAIIVWTAFLSTISVGNNSARALRKYYRILLEPENFKMLQSRQQLSLGTNLGRFAICVDDPSVELRKYCAISDDDGRLELMRELADELSIQKSAFRATCWNVWLRQFLVDRSDGLPVSLSVNEAAKLFELTVLIEERFDSAVDVALTVTPALEDGELFDYMKEHEIHKKNPISAFRLIKHLVPAIAVSDFSKVESLIVELCDAPLISVPQFDELCNELSRAGCERAGTIANHIKDVRTKN